MEKKLYDNHDGMLSYSGLDMVNRLRILCHFGMQIARIIMESILLGHDFHNLMSDKFRVGIITTYLK